MSRTHILGLTLLALALGGVAALVVTPPRPPGPSAAGRSEAGAVLAVVRSGDDAGGRSTLAGMTADAADRAASRAGAGGSTGAGPAGASADSASGGAGARGGRDARGSSGSELSGGATAAQERAADAARRRRRPDGRDGWLGPDDEVLDADEGEDDVPPGTGLLGSYWKRVDETVRSFTAPDETPTLQRVDPTVDFGGRGAFRLPFETRNLIVHWGGFLRAPEDAVYTLIVGSDDGARLVVDGRTAVEMDQLQPYRESSAEVFLTEGFHPVELLYYQNEGEAACRLLWVPADGIPALVPQEVLYPRDALPPSVAPEILSAEPPGARYGQTITIRGRGFPEPAEAFDVTFDGRPVQARALAEGEVLVTIPPGVAAGEMRITVRGATSAPFTYEVGDIFGLLATYRRLEGNLTSLDTLPDGPVAFSRIEETVGMRHGGAFRLPLPPYRFAAALTGLLYVPRPGEVTLWLQSDDGSRLLLDGAPVIDNDGLHGMKAVSAPLQLDEGFHDIEVAFFQNGGGAGLDLRWDLGAGLVPVPKGCLYPPRGFEILAPVALERLEPSEVEPGGEVAIIGSGFGFDASALRVTVGATEMPILEMTDRRVLVRVPDAARTGPLVVQVGPVASASLDLTVLGSGLHAAYVRIGGPIAELGAIDRLEPDFETIVPDLHFGEGFSFGLPFPAEQFAAVFTGTIDAPREGDYVFSLYSDDGARLEIDGRLVVDHDGLHGLTRKDGEVYLTSGAHPIRLVYFQNLGAAGLDLHWQVPGAGIGRVPGRALFPR